MTKSIFAGLSLLLLAPPLDAQGGCPGEPFVDSSPRAASLSKFTPAAREGGIAFHSWLDTGRSQPRAHLVVENGNAFPVAVRYRVELRGSRGSMDHGERCVTIRAHEYVLDTGGNTVFAYHASPLWGIHVSDVRITSLSTRPEPRKEVARRAPVVAASPTATRAAPPPKAPSEPPAARNREAAPASAPDTVPARSAAALRPEPPADTALAVPAASGERIEPDTARARPREATVPARETVARSRPERPPAGGRKAATPREPRMRTAGAIFGIAFGALLTIAGTMLLVAIAGALYLLVFLGAVQLVRRVLPSRAGAKG